jgi:hypothetical protein
MYRRKRSPSDARLLQLAFCEYKVRDNPLGTDNGGLASHDQNLGIESGQRIDESFGQDRNVFCEANQEGFEWVIRWSAGFGVWFVARGLNIFFYSCLLFPFRF